MSDDMLGVVLVSATWGALVLTIVWMATRR